MGWASRWRGFSINLLSVARWERLHQLLAVEYMHWLYDESAVAKRSSLSAAACCLNPWLISWIGGTNGPVSRSPLLWLDLVWLSMWSAVCWTGFQVGLGSLILLYHLLQLPFFFFYSLKTLETCLLLCMCVCDISLCLLLSGDCIETPRTQSPGSTTVLSDQLGLGLWMQTLRTSGCSIWLGQSCTSAS